ncbi:transposase [Deinococcus marmoris]|uniref:transposase n=1 Tax=Deinococcus marmoris TaxID=249408 RepID=UPI0009DDD05E|nr:transposase [Deinococcus marmoris]
MKTRQFTEDQIIKLLQEGKKGEKPIEDLCRDFGCSPASYYTWKKKYGDTNADEAKRRLGQNTTRNVLPQKRVAEPTIRPQTPYIAACQTTRRNPKSWPSSSASPARNG